MQKRFASLIAEYALDDKRLGSVDPEVLISLASPSQQEQNPLSHYGAITFSYKNLNQNIAWYRQAAPAILKNRLPQGSSIRIFSQIPFASQRLRNPEQSLLSFANR